MNLKKITLSSLFAFLVVASFVAATVSITVSPGTLNFVEDGQSLTFGITNVANESVNLTYTTLTPITQGSTTASFTLINPPVSLGASGTPEGTKTVTVTLTGNPQDFDFGEKSRELTVTATNPDDPTDFDATQKVNLKFSSSFCSAGSKVDVEDLDVTLDDIDLKVSIDNNGDGKDLEWELLDEIEVEVDFDNDGNDNIDDVILELGLFDSGGKNVANDLDFRNDGDEEIELGDVKDGDKETDTFIFRVPADLDPGNYKLAIKAYSDKENEEDLCIDFTSSFDDKIFQKIEINQKNDQENFIVVDDIVLDSQVTCGDTVTGSFTVYNVGDGGEEDRVLITMKNVELGVDQSFEITKSFDEGDDETFSFSFKVPGGVEDKLHVLNFRTEYDYRKGVYKEISEDTFVGFVEVLGCSLPGPSGPSTNNLIISAILSSQAKAGEELVVKSTITNIGPEIANVLVNAKAFESWSELVSVTPSLVTIASGQSQIVTFTLQVDEDVSGPESFVIETNTNGNLQVQEVEVNIEGKNSPSGGITGFAGLNLGEGNGLVWVIVIVNVILIILIILVAVRLSRR